MFFVIVIPTTDLSFSLYANCIIASSDAWVFLSFGIFLNRAPALACVILSLFRKELHLWTRWSCRVMLVWLLLKTDPFCWVAFLGWMRSGIVCILDHWLVVLSFCKFCRLKWYSVVPEWIFSEIVTFAYPFKSWLMRIGSWIHFRLWYTTITLRGRFLRGSHVPWELSWSYSVLGTTRYSRCQTSGKLFSQWRRWDDEGFPAVSQSGCWSPRCSRDLFLSLIHIWRCRRYSLCRSRWSPYH